MRVSASKCAAVLALRRCQLWSFHVKPSSLVCLGLDWGVVERSEQTSIYLDRIPGKDIGGAEWVS